MNATELAAEAEAELWIDQYDPKSRDKRVAIIQAAIERAVNQHREAIEELVDWQNGPPLLSPKWLNGWNRAMEKACALIGRQHEPQNL